MYCTLFSLFSIYYCTKNNIPNPNNTINVELIDNDKFEQTIDKNNLTQTNSNLNIDINTKYNQNIDVESLKPENNPDNLIIVELINKLNERFNQLTNEINEDVNKVKEGIMQLINSANLVNTIDKKFQQLTNGVELVDKINNGFKQLIKGINDDINKIKRLYIILLSDNHIDNKLLDTFQTVNEIN